jgi:hypothetical protein
MPCMHLFVLLVNNLAATKLFKNFMLFNSTFYHFFYVLIKKIKVIIQVLLSILLVQ